MRLTSKGRYAVRAMLDITFYSQGKPVRLQEISDRQNISLHYLEQLFRKLRTGQVVKSIRGPGGGYVLHRHMDEISMSDVLKSVGENIDPAKDILGSEAERTDSTREFLLSKDYFQNLGLVMQEYLSTTTLGDLKRKWQTGDLKADEPAVLDVAPEAEVVYEPSISTKPEGFESLIRSSLGDLNQ